MPTTIVAIPVCNEEERIGACLAALAAQTGLPAGTLGILLLLNNCTDRTAEIVAAAASGWPMRVVERIEARASAGWARRLAMEEAAAWLRGGSGGVLMTTDADSRVEPDWVPRNLAAIAAGADAVAGRLALDADDAALLPASLHARGRREAAYEAMLTEICARLDPQAGDPWPCHWSKSGATIAVTLATYDAVGGMPDQPTGEDRAFVEAIIARDRVVRHDPGIVVVTSGRLEGRATGGVADTIRLRCEDPEAFCDDRLEVALRVVMRCRLRRQLRDMWHAGLLRAPGRWSSRLAIPEPLARQIAATPFFGAAHAAIESASPRLRYRPIRPRQLPRQMWIARVLLRLLRLRDRAKSAGETGRRPSIFASRRSAEAGAPLPRHRRAEHPLS